MGKGVWDIPKHLISTTSTSPVLKNMLLTYFLMTFFWPFWM